MTGLAHVVAVTCCCEGMCLQVLEVYSVTLCFDITKFFLVVSKIFRNFLFPYSYCSCFCTSLNVDPILHVKSLDVCGFAKSGAGDYVPPFEPRSLV